MELVVVYRDTTPIKKIHSFLGSNKAFLGESINGRFGSGFFVGRALKVSYKCHRTLPDI